MGQDSSRPEDVAEEEEGIDVETLCGYRVMKVFPGSPASRAGLGAFEDFIVAVNRELVEGDGALGSALKALRGVACALSVWNCVDKEERTVTLTPDEWNGPGLLGAAVRFEPIRAANDHVWHVTDVFRDSPADDAGLVPQSDYIVGTAAQVFRASDALSNLLLEASKSGVPAPLMVYSSATSRTRTVEILPRNDWGGDGLLGCELATGLLHQVARERAPE